MDKERFLSSPAAVATFQEGRRRIALADQETNGVWVHDLEKGVCDEPSLVWSFQAPWPEIFQDIRLRRGPNGRELLLAACSNGFARMIDVAGKVPIWESDDLAVNPHAIELLPNGILAVGCSTGGQVCFFDLNSPEPERSGAAHPLVSAHGLVYDEERDRLWALGKSELHRLEVSPDGAGGIRLTLEAVYMLPSPGGHDLWPVPGSGKRRLWVTNHGGVFQFSTADGTFSSQYPGAEAVSCSNTKAIGSFPDGTVVSMVPDGGYFSWTAASFRIFSPNGASYDRRELSIPGRASYKVRIWSPDYR